MSTPIALAGPSITDREIDAVLDAVRTGWCDRADDFQERFARAFARHAARRCGLELPSGTSALHLALAALGIGPGDEVIVPDVTWIATAAPVRYVGATAVFADIDPATWCVSADTIRVCVSPRTRAIIVVELYGCMPDWDGIAELAATHGLAVIEDAAEAIGARWRGRPAGSFGDASVFSFHGSKTLTTGEGGMLLTDRRELDERARFLRDHGRHPGDTSYENIEVAYKYRMSALQAALGLAQLERVDELVARKREIFAWYAEDLAGLPLTLNPEPPGATGGCWLPTAVLDAACGVSKKEAGAALARAGVASRPFFNPLSGLAAYADEPEAAAARARNAVAYDLSPRGISLPAPATLARQDVRHIARALSQITG